MRKLDFFIFLCWLLIVGLLYGSGGTRLWDRSNLGSVYEQKRASDQAESALELCNAIRDNDLERLGTVLEENPSATKVLLACPCYGCEHGNRFYRTPLNDALELDRKEMVSLLLKYGAPETRAKYPRSSGIIISFPDARHDEFYHTYKQPG